MSIVGVALARKALKPEIGSILDTVPLNVRRRFPELETRHIEHIKREIVKAQNIAAGLDGMLPELLDEYIAGSG